MQMLYTDPSSTPNVNPENPEASGHQQQSGEGGQAAAAERVFLYLQVSRLSCIAVFVIVNWTKEQHSC